MRLHLATLHRGRLAHVCIRDTFGCSIPVCHAREFYPVDRVARKKCPACIAVIRKLLRQRPKR